MLSDHKRTLLDMLRYYIPLIFAAVILFFLFSLYKTNQAITAENVILKTSIREKVERIDNLRSRGDDTQEIFKRFAGELEKYNGLLAAETSRRAAAETESHRLQEEMKKLMRSNKCAIALIPGDPSDPSKKSGRLEIGPATEPEETTK